MPNELAKVGSGGLQLAKEAPTVGQMLAVVIEKDMTMENVAVIKELMAIQARREFAEAFVNLQADMRNVVATKPVPNKDGTVRYKYAPFEDIMEQVGPQLKAHGFTVRFSTSFDDKRIIKTCILQHTGGHFVETTFAVRSSGGPPGSSSNQADGSDSTYAKRYALCEALNIIVDRDNDARAEGGTVTPQQAEELEHRLKMVNGDVGKFLKVAGAAKFSEIVSSKYAMLDDMLAKKEGRA